MSENSNKKKMSPAVPIRELSGRPNRHTFIFGSGNGKQQILSRIEEGRRNAFTGGGCSKCKCRTSQCLQLYCSCFASEKYCSTDCLCERCRNRREFDEEVLEAKQKIHFLDKHAFCPKVQQDPDTNGDIYRKGCNCKKSGCAKKYCECFLAGVECSEKCNCFNCRNFRGSKSEGRENVVNGETGTTVLQELCSFKVPKYFNNCFASIDCECVECTYIREFVEEVHHAKKRILQNNTNVFNSKFVLDVDLNEAFVGCSKSCRCLNCNNVHGKREVAERIPLSCINNKINISNSPGTAFLTKKNTTSNCNPITDLAIFETDVRDLDPMDDQRLNKDRGHISMNSITSPADAADDNPNSKDNDSTVAAADDVHNHIARSSPDKEESAASC